MTGARVMNESRGEQYGDWAGCVVKYCGKVDSRFLCKYEKANKAFINLRSYTNSPAFAIFCASFVVEILKNQLAIWRPVSSVRANVTGQYNRYKNYLK